MPEPFPSQVDALLEQCILLAETGDQPAIDALLGQHPDLAPVLRERLQQLAALGMLQPPRKPPPLPERLGDFRLLRPIGRGGMGIVYRAEQTTLQREVALKLVHPEQLFFRGARERFRREVLAVARLQHPGIVPILTCGEADGIPFYAMDLVAGASLAEVLGELAGTAPRALDGPALRAALQRALAAKQDLTAITDAPLFHGAWANTCCRLVLDAAEALQHAHEHGVLHRDVKPSNLLLAANGRVRVIDFGLASAEGEQRITRSGATFGSVPYMAPEQLRGDTAQIDSRTDVYALGVTLYELLTLALPHGDGGGATRERILAGHVEPPSRLNPLVHADVEAVCLMAMDLDPARRYPDAGALAADLRAFLEHRSVRARRPSPWLRARRWARRNPVRAAVAAVLFVVLVPGPLALAVQQNRAADRIQQALDEADAQRRAAERNLVTANQERQRAELRLDQALEAVDRMLTRTATARLAEIPRTAQLRRELLQDAAEFHERLLASAGEGAANDRVRLERARTQTRLARLQGDLGDLPRALELATQAVADLEALLAADDVDDALRHDLTQALEVHGDVLGATEQVAAWLAVRRRAVEVCSLLVQRRGRGQDVERSARAQLDLASALADTGDVAAAKAGLDALDRDLTTTSGPWHEALPAVRRQLLRAETANTRGILLARTGAATEATHEFERALRLLDDGPAELAAVPSASVLRLGLLERLGLILHQRWQWQAAAPWLDRTCAEYERLRAAEPEVPGWSARLAIVLGTRATNRRRIGDLAAAAADHDRAVMLLQDAVRIAPTHQPFRRSLAIALAERADSAAETGDAAAANRDFELAEQEFAAAVAAVPSDTPTQNNRLRALANHAECLAANGDYETALTRFEYALAIVATLADQGAVEPRIQLLLQGSDMAGRAGDAERALSWVEMAWTQSADFLAQRPDDPQRRLLRTIAGLNCGTTLVVQDRHAEAIRCWTEALPIAQQNLGQVELGRRMLAALLLRLADVHLRLGDAAVARSWFVRALEEADADAALVGDLYPLPNLFHDDALIDLLPPGHPDLAADAGQK
ncbi:MAG: protein kinase [Planctomycetes bacterium]|nr:protein kinase [Planctomycetota bacterium]